MIMTVDTTTSPSPSLITPYRPVRVEASSLRVETSTSQDSTFGTRSVIQATVVTTPAVGDAVLGLLHAQDADEIDEVMGELQGKLRQGDTSLALDLNRMARTTGHPGVTADERGLAIQTLAGARIRGLADFVFRLIADACQQDVDRVKVSAIAAATHLPREKRGNLRPIVEQLSRHSNRDVQRAAQAFLAVNQ